VIVGLGVFGFTGMVGLLVAPAAAPLLWSVLVGLGMSVFSLALTVIALGARTGEDTAQLSGMAQGFGYLLAALGPFLFGLLRELTGGWTVPFIMLLVVFVAHVGFRCARWLPPFRVAEGNFSPAVGSGARSR
jgi:CP family cyanate transporter-like MFS transporter